MACRLITKNYKIFNKVLTLYHKILYNIRVAKIACTLIFIRHPAK